MTAIMVFYHQVLGWLLISGHSEAEHSSTQVISTNNTKCKALFHRAGTNDMDMILKNKAEGCCGCFDFYTVGFYPILESVLFHAPSLNCFKVAVRRLKTV